MPLALLKYGLRKQRAGEPYFPPAKPLRPDYDVVVIIGGGGHGLACAYCLLGDSSCITCMWACLREAACSKVLVKNVLLVSNSSNKYQP